MTLGCLMSPVPVTKLGYWVWNSKRAADMRSAQMVSPSVLFPSREHRVLEGSWKPSEVLDSGLVDCFCRFHWLQSKLKNVSMLGCWMCPERFAQQDGLRLWWRIILVLPFFRELKRKPCLRFYSPCPWKNTGFVKVWGKASLSNESLVHSARLIFASQCSGIASPGNAHSGVPSLASCSWSLTLGFGQLMELFRRAPAKLLSISTGLQVRNRCYALCVHTLRPGQALLLLSSFSERGSSSPALGCC